MIKTISFSEFCDAFPDMYINNFTYEGKRALFDHLEEYEDAMGEPYELDIVALCCEYTEYASFEELQEAYPNMKTIEEVEDSTVVIPVELDGHIIVQDF